LLSLKVARGEWFRLLSEADFPVVRTAVFVDAMAAELVAVAERALDGH